MLSLHHKKIKEIALRESNRGRVVLASHLKEYEGKRPKPIGKNKLKPDLEIYSKTGELLEIIAVNSGIMSRRHKMQVRSLKISAARRGAQFKTEGRTIGTSDKKTGNQVAIKFQKQKKQSNESELHERILNAEKKHYNELSTKLLKEVASGEFESFYKVVKREVKKHPDLYEWLFGSFGSYWLKNRLLVIWDACVERDVKVSNVKVTKFPADYNESPEKVLLRLYLSGAIAEIVELAAKVVTSRLAIFSDEFESKILKKEVLFMIHQADCSHEK